jgi:hypothetical protein
MRERPLRVKTLLPLVSQQLVVVVVLHLIQPQALEVQVVADPRTIAATITTKRSAVLGPQARETLVEPAVTAVHLLPVVAVALLEQVSTPQLPKQVTVELEGMKI